MAKKIEIMFSEKDGRFVVHFNGVATHDQEHEMLDALLARLRKLGFDVEVEHHHDDPKLPELGEDQLPGRERETGGGR